MENSFTDLRQNDGRLVDDSFWPSFTDVMTVIVMIFLITTTVLIIKNWELVRELEQRILKEKDISAALKETIVEKNKTHQQLLANVAAKKQISLELEASIVALQKTNEIAEQNQAENKTLEEQLEHAKAQLRLLNLQLINTNVKLSTSQDIAAKKQHAIMKQQQQIVSLEEKINNTLRAIDIKEKNIAENNNKIENLQSLLETNRGQTSKLQSDLETSHVEKLKLRENLKQEQSLLSESKVTIQTWKQKLKALMDRFFKVETQLQDKDALFLQEKQTSLVKIQLLEKSIIDKESQLTDLNKKTEARTIALEINKKALLSINNKYQKAQNSLSEQMLISQNQQQKLQNLNDSHRLKQQQIASMEKQILLAQQQQGKQQKKFTELEEKYKKLIRPARSALGKYVVEVRYEKIKNKVVVSYKDVSDDKFDVLAIAEINKRLAKLKKQYAQRLYVKVIIPDNSGLSYKEAWQFMQDIFNKYDYYYQDSENKL